MTCTLCRFVSGVMVSGVMGALLSAAAPALASESTHHADLRAKFEAELAAIDADFEGTFGARFVDLTTGEAVSLNADRVFPTASTIKVPILVELFRQAESRPGLLAQQRPFAVNGAAEGGMARLISPGSSLSLEDIAKLMINLSENNATNILIDEVGMDSVNALTASFGLKTMRLQRKMLDRDSQARGAENIASPADAAALMTRIARCELPVSQPACARIREIMEIDQPPHPAKDGIPRNIPIAFKWGGLEGVSAGWAIVDLPDRPYVFAIMTSFGTDNAAAVRAASDAAYSYYGRLARANAYGSRVSADVMRDVREQAAQR